MAASGCSRRTSQVSTCRVDNGRQMNDFAPLESITLQRDTRTGGRASEARPGEGSLARSNSFAWPVPRQELLLFCLWLADSLVPSCAQ